ncbi:transmembrane protein, putative [Medicago truncatula]|uniref:Transmembrane protein, putative n=1 Tax=Medicago truncatula TaxID=3880 RepID=A0A072VLZ1_MEDTR|nr:transmembrane protein, putative [Medicago truncatula]
MPPNLFIHRKCWSGGFFNKKIRKGLRMIWEVTIWVLWRTRNGCIFNNEVVRWEEVVEEVMRLFFPLLWVCRGWSVGATLAAAVRFSGAVFIVFFCWELFG